MATGTAKRTTARDIAAAVKLGAMDPDSELMTPSDVAALVSASVTAKASIPVAASAVVASVPLSSTEHDCAIPGCRHGNAHPVVSQPDRQVKLQCPGCGAVARMTSAAIGRTGGTGIVCGGDGAVFVVAVRRTYSRKVQA